ncbi:MAG: hypothetical protein LV481_11135 [Methylacidiphilales bacterium]|nr:hypothetical protein [Candidatus Methylacidiphilales bacterium]
MRQVSKETIETRHVDALMTFLDLKCKVERGVEPAPDFLFRNNTRTVGLEHTRLFAEPGTRKGTLQARENLIDDIAETVRLEYERRGLPPIEVKLHIGRGRIGKARIKPMVIEIVNAIERYLPSNPGRSEIDNTGEEGLAAEVDSVRMIRFPNQVGVSFFAPRSAWILSIDANHLQNVVDEKAKRLPGYLARCDEVWLLMAAEGDELSTTMEMPEALWSHVFDSRGFSRLFVLGVQGKVHELQH